MRLRSQAWVVVVALAAGAAACVPAPVAQPGWVPPGEARAEGEIADAWFASQRRDESGAIPLRARARAVAQVRRMGAFGTVGSWVQAGPVNVGGRISTMAVDPHDPDRIWIGAADGGVFLSVDGGASWASASPEQTALSIGSIATHPTDSDVVYVGTGEEAGGGFSYDGEGVLRTIDGGASWTNLGLAEVRRIGKLAIDPANSDRVFAAMWQRYRGDGLSYSGGAASGIYLSIDGGDHFSQLTTGLPSGVNVGRIGLAIAPTNPQTV